MTRTAFLRKQARDSAHKYARVAMPESWSTADLPGGIAERKAQAMAMLFDRMPVYIGKRELIVGSRTMLGHRGEALDPSDMDVVAMPHYLSDADRASLGGGNGEFTTKAHCTPDFSRILRLGIDGLIDQAKRSPAAQGTPLKRGWLRAVVIAYEAVSRWIGRYAEEARALAEAAEGERRGELLRIAEVCRHIAHQPPRDFYEAVQLFWFASLATIVEQFHWVNYGRVDQLLFPYYDAAKSEEAQQLIDCLLLKMYDGADMKAERFGAQGGQLNITLGGVTPAGENAVNALTYLFLNAIGRTRLPEPEVACRIHSLNPPDYLERCAELSISGVNCIAYYHDDQWIESMAAVGIPLEVARDYAFDLCQDINIPGRGDFYSSGTIDLGRTLLQTMGKVGDNGSFASFLDAYRRDIAETLRRDIETYNLTEQAIRAYVSGDEAYLLEMIETGRLAQSAANPLMSPLPLTSALYENCLETGTDLSWFGCPITDRGYIIGNPVVAINGLAALRKRVFEEKRFRLSQVLAACDNDFEGEEVMRQLLWTAPKWGNDDDDVDLPAKAILEFACDEILRYRTPGGGRHLAGIHQAHPVYFGMRLQATPEGRKAGQPVPVSLSPENGTMEGGATAAFCSATKIDPLKYQWNNCVMLQYFTTVFEGNEGPRLLAGLIRDYFAAGGTQHQPNIVSVEALKNARLHPEDYRDLIIRMWGVSAHFVDLPREVQDEFIARFDPV